MIQTADILTDFPKLLLVEDEFLIANDLQRMLLKAGYQITGIAASATEAADLVVQQRPDIVLLDIFLEGEETGIDFAPWLRERHIPFVYLSANLSDRVLEAAKITQPYGFLNKPFREKDVLTTLEIARYRHAHGEEARLRQQQAIQIAVNNAIVTIQERDQLCLAIADQINKLVPFSFLNLRIGVPSDESFYGLMLRKTSHGTFERIHLATLLNTEISEELHEQVEREVVRQSREKPGIFTGKTFDDVCERYLTARACRDNLGARSFALFPILLKRASVATIHLTSTDADAFTQSAYELVSLVIPQIALALDNLLAYEEIEIRRQTKAAELAIVNAFQNGRDLDEIIPKVATAINILIPFDLLDIYRFSQPIGSSTSPVSVQKIAGSFVSLPSENRSVKTSTLQQNQENLADLPSWLLQPTIHVGDQRENAMPGNLLTQLYDQTLGVKSSMGVPIVIKEQTVASLVLGSKAAYAFTKKDLKTLQGLSSQMALALENVLAFEQIKVLSEQLEQEKTYLSEEIKTSQNFEEIIGTSPALLDVFNSIGQVAPTDYTVLIMGETGTGKELIARAIHNLSGRKSRSMVKVNCAVLPPNLIESELFGHERGSFTGATEKRIGKFEMANGGTLFLDEIGELPIELQSKLLRAIQEKEIERIGGKGTIYTNIRIIAATNRNLQQEVTAGRFRSDLYYRLNVFPILLPTLRERREDILPLAMYFLRKISKKLGKPLTGIANPSLKQMMTYPWPGNIRELEHILERAAIISRSSTLELAEPLMLPSLAPVVASSLPGLVKPMQDAMRETILAALAQSKNRIRGTGGAADLLKIKPTTLEARMKKLDISTRQL